MRIAPSGSLASNSGGYSGGAGSISSSTALPTTMMRFSHLSANFANGASLVYESANSP
jgi:hypothetical protein